MKTLGRILIILIAALTVIGAIYALSQTAAFSALAGQSLGSGEAEGRSGPPDLTNGESGQSIAMTGRPEGRGGSWETVGRNLLQIITIVAAVQVLWSIGRWLKWTAASPTHKDRLNPSHS